MVVMVRRRSSSRTAGGADGASSLGTSATAKPVRHPTEGVAERLRQAARTAGRAKIDELVRAESASKRVVEARENRGGMRWRRPRMRAGAIR